MKNSLRDFPVSIIGLLIWRRMFSWSSFNPSTNNIRYSSQFEVLGDEAPWRVAHAQSSQFFAQYERLEDSLSTDATGVSTSPLEFPQIVILAIRQMLMSLAYLSRLVTLTATQLCRHQ